MTQAPTPGPLTAPAEPYRLVVGDWREEPRTIHGPDGYLVGGLEPDDARRLCAELNRLAPPAPVEASGSEREDDEPTEPEMQRAEVVSALLRYSFEGGAACDVADEIIGLLRPQPSGEARAALDRLKMAAHVYEDDEMAADCATLEALLSARPLAREQSTQEDRDWAMAEAMKIKDTPMPSFNTTSARAEAQDEGAAGEPVGHIRGVDDVLVVDWARNVMPPAGTALYAHPSPTPDAEPRKVSALPLEGDPVQQMTGLTVADALDDPVSSLDILRALTTSRTLCVWADGTYRVMPTMDVPVARNEEGTLIGVIPMAEIGEVATPSAYEFQERIAELEAQLTAADADRVRIAVEALKFYADGFDWYPGDGEAPDATFPGSAPTFYEASAKPELVEKGGSVAAKALAALKTEGK